MCAARIEKSEIKIQNNVMSQADVDARWTKKGEEPFWV